MLRSSGKPTGCFETMLKSVGFPLLFVALAFAAILPSARSFPAVDSDTPRHSFIVGEGTHAATVRTSPVLLDLSGWELYLHSATEGLSSFGLSPVVGTLSLAGGGAAEVVMASQPPPALPLRISYNPQAPPIPV